MAFIKQDRNNPDREQDIVPVYLNKKERMALEELKKYWGVKQDSTILKKCAFSTIHYLIDNDLEYHSKPRGL